MAASPSTPTLGSSRPVRHGAFHPLTVAAVDRLTDDSVALTLEVPEALRAEYRHAPGQHLTLRRSAPGGAEIRRTYSICSPAPDPGGPGAAQLRVGVRLVEGGEFSTFAHKEIAAGDVLDVMVPAGRFVLEPASAPATGHYAAIVGGSGITPVLSIAATLLKARPEARFCLVRSDRTAASTMFLEEVADLKDRYPDRFQLVTVLSREEQEAGLPSGRLDQERLAALLPALLPVADVTGWFLCGPYGLVQGAERALGALGVVRSRVHEEIFHVEDTAPPAPAPSAAAAHGRVTARLDGRSGTWPVRDGESLLDAVLRNRADAPYACKGGVCGTCRAFLVTGEVRMDRNFALEAEETEAGFVLACQSHAVTEEVEIDFDR
ncbi:MULTISPECIES: 2Fe-2S iron-sulfur cluster-binding protein [unclassified Streptomyces]|uniref:2Fe-2S iron-sulfur cluster-binding protein n=1 Tax=unclassified Streptomyces TaxID=2593676 RepID=UPI001BE6B4A0|nr:MULTISPECIES: 2Fe-2S iron-sulfur cluster-binding protein [unclassified Streptomyces]MBT2404080.1 2Fe-2S iron-sulfur cluster binding domain-containing protein [Streptomyces sp. ISL-21]MBT2454363.1 2Fe-2S iron-sulfur cluster binding domain-containing protein [Streptomyces sp. ISL-86]MBT2607875.1 2Fe-2S iron-sulfur cluster binding domain-containing protein [Streptomyces sp. ISL-87]